MDWSSRSTVPAKKVTTTRCLAKMRRSIITIQICAGFHNGKPTCFNSLHPLGEKKAATFIIMNPLNSTGTASHGYIQQRFQGEELISNKTYWVAHTHIRHISTKWGTPYPPKISTYTTVVVYTEGKCVNEYILI